MYTHRLITDLSLDYVVRENTPSSPSDPIPLLILLHGIGSDEQDLFGLIDFIDERYLVVSARAPYRYEYGGNSWFDIDLAEDSFRVDEQQLLASEQKIQAFLTELIDRYQVDPQQIYVCGFSQGGFMALFTMLTTPLRIAGTVAMSSRIAPDVEKYFAPREQFTNKPMLIVHGTQDDVIPLVWARRTRDILTQLPIELEYHEFEMRHEISFASLDVVVQWLEARLVR